MADTKDKKQAMLDTLATRVRPPFTEAEHEVARQYVEDGLDPVVAAEKVVGERVALNSRAVRERDGDPYPAMVTLLDPADAKARAKEGFEAEFGDAGPSGSADVDAERRARAEAEAEVERLRADVEALRGQAGDGVANAAALETERAAREAAEAEVAALRAETEALREQGGGKK